MKFSAFNLSKFRSDAVVGFYSPQTRFWELLAGSLFAYLSLHKRDSFKGLQARLDAWLGRIIYAQAPDADGATLRNVLAILGASLLAAGILIITKDRHFPGYWAIVPVLGATLIIAAGANAWFNRVLLSNPVVVWFGLISFPLYLWHWPLLSFARIIEGEIPARNIRIGVVVLSIILGWMTYRLIEKPFRFGGNSRIKTISLACLMLTVGYAGYNAYSRDGWRFRAIAKLGAKISDAKSDWKYKSTTMASGKIENLNVLPGMEERSVLFIGDSLIGQYYPRAEYIYSQKRKPRLTTVFASRNHCGPVPNFDHISAPELINCIEYYRAAIELAKEPRYARIVFGGNWPSFDNGDGLTEQAALLAKDMDELRNLGKEVFIIAHPPMHAAFDPAVIAKMFRKGFSTTLENQSMRRDVLENLGQLRTIRLLSDKTGAVLINPFDYFCQNNECPFVLDGEPLFHDGAHIRASHARTLATFVDALSNDEMPEAKRSQGLMTGSLPYHRYSPPKE